MALDAGTAFVDIQPSVGAGFFAGMSSKFAASGAILKGIGLGVGAGLAVGIGAGIAAFKIGDNFDKAFDTIRVGTGATGDALKDLEGDFKTVFSNVPSSMEDASIAIADLNTRTGLVGEPLRELATTTLDLARITGEDLAGTIDTTTRLFGDWGVATEDQAGTLDKLFRAGQATGTGINKLATDVVQFGAPLRQLGFSMDESIALFGKWNKEGVNTEAIMGGLKQAVGRFAKEGLDVPEAFDAISESIKNAGTDSEATAIAIEAFGTRAGPDLAAAVREGRFELSDMVDVIANGEETIATASADTESFGEKWKKFANKLLVAVEPIATRVFEGMGKLMDAVGPHIPALMDKFGEFFSMVNGWIQTGLRWWEKNKETILSFVAAVITGLREAFAVIQTVFQTIVGWFQRSSEDGDKFGGKWAEIWDKIQTVFTTAAELLQAVMAALTAFWQEHGEAILAHVERIWDTIQTVISAVLDIIIGIFEVFIGIFTGDWQRAWDGILAILQGFSDLVIGVVTYLIDQMKLAFTLALDFILLLWERVWDSIKSAASAVMDTVLELVAGWWAGITGWFGDIATGISEAWTGVWDSLTGIATGAWDTFIGWVEGAWDLFKGWWDGIWDTAAEGMEGAFSGIVGTIRAVLNGILWVLERGINAAIRAINTAIRGANIVNPFKDIPYVGEISIPRLARGGDILRSGLALVGEAGPEELYLPEGAQVRPLPRQTRNMEGTANITVMLDGRVLARAIGAPLMDEVVIRTGIRRT